MDQVKKSPGRPKAQPTPQVRPVVTEAKKKPVIRREEELKTTAEYEIPSRAGVVFMLPQKGITVYDKEQDTVREMRYCPNEPSIWVDEQSDNAIKETVAFREGKIFVAKEKPNLKKFLDLHPMNISNGGKVFREVNKKRDAEMELQKEFKLNEAIALVNQPTTEIRYNLLNIAKKNPKEFIESFDSPQVTTRASIQQAADYQIINVKDNGCYWFDSNSLIVSVPVGQDPMDVMVRFCLTERGATVLSDIEDRLEKLA
jgi:hypothetical protein